MRISPISINNTVQIKKEIFKNKDNIKINPTGNPQERKPLGQFIFGMLFPKLPQFKEGQIPCSDNNKIFNRPTTYFFRKDLNWKEFLEVIQERFKNANKVNTYIWGCSKGDEAYSLAMLLDRYFGAESEKFFPIEAKDIDEETIKSNKTEQSERVISRTSEKEKIKKVLRLTPNEESKYYSVFPGTDSIKLNSDCIKKINFEASNIVTDLGLIDSENPSLVMCRNMWPYINPDKYESCAKELYDRLAKGSLMVIGDYDCFGELGYFGSKDFPKELIKAGFTPVYIKGVGDRSSLSEDELKQFVLIYERN